MADQGGFTHLTDELLDQLIASATPEAYLAQAAAQGDLDDRDFAAYLGDLLSATGLTRADVIRASGLNPTFTYQVFAGQRHVSRDTALMLAFGLRCDVPAAQHLLIHAGVAPLYSRVRRDAVILYCLAHGRTRAECDDELFAHGEEVLLKDETASAQTGRRKGDGGT